MQWFRPFFLFSTATFLGASTATSKIRFAQCSEDAGSVTLVTGGQSLFTGIAFAQVSDHLLFPSGANNFSAADVVDQPFMLEAGTVYTLALLPLPATTASAGATHQLKLLVDADQFSDLFTSFRLINALSDVPAVDMHLDNQPEFAAVAFAASSPVGDAVAGEHTVQLYKSGDATPLLNTSVTVASSTVYALFLVGSSAAPRLVQALDTSFAEFSLRIAQLSPDAPALYVSFADGMARTRESPTVGNYLSVTGYQPAVFQDGDGIIVSGPSGDLFAVDPPQWLTLGHYTLAVYGRAADDTLGGTFLLDNVSPPRSRRNAKLNFYHASPDAGAVDLWLDGQLLFADVQYAAATQPSVELPSWGEQRIENSVLRLFPAGTTTTPLAQLVFSAPRGSVQNVYAAGLRDQLTMIVSNPFSYNYTSFKVVHASPSLPAVDIVVGTATVFTGVSYPSVSSYLDFPFPQYHNGPFSLQLLPTGCASCTPLLTRTVDLSGDSYTLLIAGSNSSDQAVDAVALADEDLIWFYSAVVRVIHAGIGVPTIDLYVNNTLLEAGIAYKTSGEYELVFQTGQPVEVDVYQAGTTEPKLASASFTFADIATYTVVFYGVVSDQTNAPALTSVVDMSSRPIAAFRLVHMADGDGPLDAMVDARYKFSDVRPLTASEYDTIDVGSNASVLPAGSVTPPLATFATSPFGLTLKYTLLATKPGGVTNLHAIEDDFLFEKSEAQLRFVHAASGFAELGFSVGAPCAASSNSMFLSGSEYFNCAPAEYTVQVALTSAPNVPVATASLSAQAGFVYSVFAAATNGSANPVLQVIVDHSPARPSPPPPGPAPNDRDEGGLETWALIVITIAIILGIGGIAAIVFVVWRRWKQAAYETLR